MTRRLSKPAVDTSKSILPIVYGGTEANNVPQGTVNLGFLTSVNRGQSQGAAVLDNSKQVSTSLLPTVTDAKLASVTGSLIAYVGKKETYRITNFDSFKTYTVSVSAGSVTLSGGDIVLTPPSVTGNITLTVNGQNYSITVVPAAPKKPVIAFPLNGATEFTTLGQTAIADSFVPYGDTSSHLSSDWQLSTVTDFSTTVSQSLSDTVNKTSWAMPNLSPVTTYYLRTRYKGSNGNYSPWSNTVTFNTANEILIPITAVNFTAPGYFETGTSDKNTGVWGTWSTTNGEVLVSHRNASQKRINGGAAISSLPASAFSQYKHYVSNIGNTKKQVITISASFVCATWDYQTLRIYASPDGNPSNATMLAALGTGHISDHCQWGFTITTDLTLNIGEARWIHYHLVAEENGDYNYNRYDYGSFSSCAIAFKNWL